MTSALLGSMPMSTHVNFRNFDASPALEAYAREQAAHLEHLEPRIQRCEVIVDQPHHHHERGNRFRVQILVSVAGDELVVSHEPGADADHDDAHLAVRDAFRAARRQVETHGDRLRSHRVS